MLDIDFTNNDMFGLWIHAPLVIVTVGLVFYKVIEEWRNMHMRNQLCIVRAMLYKLSVAPPGITKEYENWRSGNMKYIEIDEDCGPIYETTLNLYEMKMKLGPEASAVLLLYFLGLADVSSVQNPIGNCALRWARLIGRLPYIYASNYEELIMSEFNITSDKESMVWIMMYLCGPDCIVTTRMFLIWRTYVNDSKKIIYTPKRYTFNIESGTAGYHPPIFIPLPRQMTSLLPGLPSDLFFDVQYCKDRTHSVRLEWIENLRKTRQKLWGESGVSIERIISLVGCSQLDGSRMNCNMGSLLSPINDYKTGIKILI
uniref:Uncharacterized protein n=1 Tax=viral metagenome TaxID=1070528 RepID=A0A6C0H2K4_9ZZZZ